MILQQIGWYDSMGYDNVKHLLRFYKRLELNLRFGYSFDYIEANLSQIMKQSSLVWQEFFGPNGRYHIQQMECMVKEDIDHILEEYWFYVYYKIYEHSRNQFPICANPELLKYLNLPLNADENMIKRRFRELCKKYHPDEGGDAYKFHELVETMKLWKEKR